MRQYAFLFILLVLAVHQAQANTQLIEHSLIHNLNDAQGWTVMGTYAGAQTVSHCAGHIMLGGYHIFGKNSIASKHWVNLPPHYKVTVTFNFFKIDSWDNESFIMYADDKVVHQSAYQYNQGSQLCGRPGIAQWTELMVPIEATFTHNLSNLMLVLTTNLNQHANDESWGFNDFRLTIHKCPEGVQICYNDNADEWKNYVLAAQYWTGQTVSAEGWTVQRAKRVQATHCGGADIFGGYDSFGAGTSISNTINNLKPHTKVIILFQFWRIDSWDGEKAYMLVDGRQLWGTTGTHASGFYMLNSICGAVHNHWTENIYDVAVRFDHSSPSLNIEISTTLNQDANDESWGVRNFQVFILDEGISQQQITQEFTDNSFVSTEGWTILNAQNKDQITNCGSVRLLGGYGVFGARATILKQFQLPPHHKVRLQLKLMKIDSWDNEEFFLFADGQNIIKQRFHYTTGTQQCGTDHHHYKEEILQIDQTFDHTASNLVLVMTSSLNEAAGNESWGIRDFVLQVQSCADKCASCNDSQCLEWKLFEQGLLGNGNTFKGVDQWVTKLDNKDVPTKTSDCAGVSLLGGYNVLGKGNSVVRTVTKLPQHKAVRVKVQFWRIDSWDQEFAIMKINGNEVWRRQFIHAQGFLNSLCGAVHNHWIEDIEDVDVVVPHDQDTLEIEVVTTINQGAADESWGIRDYQLFLQDGTLQDDDDRDALNKSKWTFTSFEGNRFEGIDDWVITGASSNDVTTNCGYHRMVGGYGVLGKGASLSRMIPLPVHYKVQLKVKLFKIDSWDNEEFRIFADGVQVYSKRFVHTQGEQLCGQKHDWREVIEVIDVEFFHSQPNLVIVFTSTLNEHANNESWGIKNFRIKAFECPKGCQTCDEQTLKPALCKNWNLISESFKNPTDSSEGWAVTGAPSKASSCANIPIFGGFNVFGKGAKIEKRIEGLPVHNHLRLKLQFWKIDKWSNEEAFIKVDKETLIWKEGKLNRDSFPASICGRQQGSNGNEDIYDVDVTFEHTAADIFIELYSSVATPANQRSWGIRDFELYSIALINVEDKGADDPSIFYKAFQGNDFQGLDGWTIVAPYSQIPITSCGGTRLMGGFGVLGKGSSLVKEITLPPHSAVDISFQLYKIDSGDNEDFQLYVDGVNIYSFKMLHSNGQQVCGQQHHNWNEQVIDVAANTKHSSSNIVILLTSTLNENADNESWGIRNFQLRINKCPDNCQYCEPNDKETAQCQQWKLDQQDLVSATQETVSNWNIENSMALFSNCGGVRIFGGFNVFGKGTKAIKTFEDIAPHNKMIVRTQFWKVDSWDNELAQLLLDGQLIWEKRYQYNEGFPYSICGQGNNWNEKIENIEVLVDHASSTAQLEFRTSLNENKDNESWGLRNVELVIENISEIKPQYTQDVKLVHSSFVDNKFTGTDGWVAVNAAQSDPITSCAGTRLFGGYKVFGKNGAAVLYKELPPHFEVRLKFTLFQIDSWDNEEFIVYVDGKEVHKVKYQFHAGQQACGASPASWKDQQVKVDVVVPHNNQNIEIILTSTVNQHANDESWGFRDFYLFAERCPEGCVICAANSLETCQEFKMISTSWGQNKDQQAEGWVVSDGKAEGTECAGIKIFGGFGKFGKGTSIARELKNLPAHNELYIRFQFWKIDSWDNERARLVVDGVQRWEQTFIYHRGSNLCGQQHDRWNEAIEDVELRIDHVDPTIQIVLATTLNEEANNESWGIRDFEIYYKEIKETVKKPNAFFASFYGNTFNDLDGWVMNGQKDDQIMSSCGQVRMVGGYNILRQGSSLSRHFVLPPHYQVNIRFKLFKIDARTNYQTKVYIDGVQAYSERLSIKNGEQLCGRGGNSHKEETFDVKLATQHNANTLNIIITNDNQDDESWGIRDFVMNIRRCPKGCGTCTKDTNKAEQCSVWTKAGEALTESDPSKFDISKWTTTGQKGKELITSCIGTPILGGYNVFGKGAATSYTFDNLPAHNVVKVKVQIWRIDSWDGEWFQIWDDDKNLLFRRQFHYKNGFVNSVCGRNNVNQWREEIENLEFEIHHVQSKLTLKFTSSLNQDANDESWGIRDLEIFTEKLADAVAVDNKDKPFYSAFMTNEFEDLDGWTPVAQADKDIITSCGQDRIYGGFGVFGKGASTMKMIRLPPHKAITIKFKLFLVDSWDNHKFLLFVDGVQVLQKLYQFRTQGTDICGHNIHRSWKDLIVDVDVTVPHTATTATIVMTSTLDQHANDESWGFREFQLQVDRCPRTCGVCKEGESQEECSQWSLVGQDFNKLNLKDNEGWAVNNGKDATFKCAGVEVFGGFGNFGGHGNANKRTQIAKTFKDLPPHNRLRVKFAFWKFDSWDRNEFATLYADRNQIWVEKMHTNQDLPNSLCGSAVKGWKEDVVMVDEIFDHTASDVELLIKTTLNQHAKDESWGIRDLVIYAEKIEKDVAVQFATKPFYQAFTKNGFEDIDGWTDSGAESKEMVTSCGGERLYGGFGVFGEGAATTKVLQLKPHTEVTIAFKLFQIDSWDNHDFLLFIDGVQVYSQRHNWRQGEDVCGNDQRRQWKEKVSQVQLKVPHNSNTLVIVMTSNLDQHSKDESWGISDFYLWVDSCPSDCVVCDKAAAITAQSALTGEKQEETNTNIAQQCSAWKLVGSSFTDLKLKDAEGWNIKKGEGKVFDCASVQILGGPKNFQKDTVMTRKFDKLPHHNKLRVKMTIWKLENWRNAAAYLIADGQVIWQEKQGKNQDIRNSICGKGVTDDIVNVDVVIDHAASDVTLVIKTGIPKDNNDESWGVRDIEVFTEQIETVESVVNKKAFYTAFTSNTFTSLDGWVMNDPYSKQPITSCDNLRVVGGYNVLGKGSSLFKHFSLPPHYQVKLRFKLLKIDSWDNEQFLLFVNGDQVYNKAFKVAQGQQACGRKGRWHEVLETVEVTVPHNQPNLLVSMTTTLNQKASDESWGIRDFELEITKCPKGCQACTKDSLKTCKVWKQASTSWTELSGLDADKWTVSDGKAEVTECSGVSMFGGFQKFGKGTAITKKFNLPIHNKLVVRFQFWKIDAWGGEELRVLVDKDLEHREKFRNQGFKVSVCGNEKKDNWREEVQDVQIVLDHTNQDTEITITTTASNNNRSWGIRDFQIFTDTANVEQAKPDETATTSDFFGNQFTDLNGWTIIQKQFNDPIPVNPITSCGGTRLVGGYGVLGRGNLLMKKFQLPPHSSVKINFKVMKIDSWDNEMFYVYADDQLLSSKRYTLQDGKQLCGNGHRLYVEYQDTYTLEFDHTAPTLQLIMTASINEVATNESWGISDFQMWVEKCPEGCAVCKKGEKQPICQGWKQFSSSWTASEGLNAEGWVAENSYSEPKESSCGLTNMFGGFNQFGKGSELSKVFFNLPPHTKVRVQVQVWLVDLWNKNQFRVLVDGKTVFQKAVTQASAIRTPLCGHNAKSGWKDQLLNIDFEVPHSENALTIEFASTANRVAKQQSWGVRDFYVYTDVVAPTVVDSEKPIYSVGMNDGIAASEVGSEWSFIGQNGKNLISKCGDKSLIGGYGVFGKNAIALYKAELPPHYEVTIKFTLYKIDSWDKEQFLVYVDGTQAYSEVFTYNQGMQMCGASNAGWKEQVQYVEIKLRHRKSDIIVQMTSTLNQHAKDESWGFRDFTINVTPCPEGCAVCDNKNKFRCQIWKPQERDWHLDNIDSDGWQVEYAQPKTYSCGPVKMFGGYGVFGANSLIKKTFKDLPAHTKIRIQVQFWKLDSWDHHRAQLFADGQEVWGRRLAGGYVKSLCGANNGWRDRAVDIDIQFLHSQDQLDLEFRTTLDQGSKDESWGVRQFHLYIGQCAEGCFDCVGTRKADCRAPREYKPILSILKGNFPDSDANGWQFLNDASNDRVTQCGDQKILGGFGILGKRAVLTRTLMLPPHYLLRVQFNFHKIDSWDHEQFIFYVDGEEAYLRSFTVTEGEQRCGQKSNWKEKVQPVDVTIRHNAPSVVLVFQTTLNQHAKDESWGLSDLVVSVVECPEGCSVCHNNNIRTCKQWSAIPPIWNSNDLVPAEGFTIKNNANNLVSSNCGGVVLLGGYNVFGKSALVQKALNNLGTHDMLRVRFQFWKIDSWDREMAYVKVDGETVWARYFTYWGGYDQPICGNQNLHWNELTQDVDIFVPHSKNSALIEISSNINQGANDESWGIREFNVFQSRCIDNCEECRVEGKCMRCRGDYVLQDGGCVEAVQKLVVAQDFTGNNFEGQQGWTFVNTDSKESVSRCGAVSLAGGFGIFGKGATAYKKFVLSPHSSLRIRFDLWIVDSWDHEELIVMVDNSVVFRENYGWQSRKRLPQCGQGHANWHEIIVPLDIIIPHEGDTATVTITSTLDQKAVDESWGFRDFYLTTDSIEECAYFYSECNFEGEFVRYCKESRNTLKTNFLKRVRSFKIPPQGKVTLFQTNEFDVQTVEVTQSNECVKDDVALHIAQQSRLLFEKSPHLRRSTR